MGKPTFDPSYRQPITVGWRYDGSMEVLNPEYIGVQGEPGELKHLSTRRKGHQRDSVSSGERTRTRPAPGMTLTGTVWNGRRKWVTAPYGTSQCQDTSKAGHVKSCLKMGGPPSKPKYSSATDSEPVP